MTAPDDARDLLAGLTPEPLRSDERLAAASARLRAAASVPGWTDSASRHALGALAARLESEASLHRHPSGSRCGARKDSVCRLLLVADRILGNEVER